MSETLEPRAGQPMPASVEPATHIIYDKPGLESIRDGTLNGLQPFTCRILVDRDSRVSHDAPDALSHAEYRGLVADSVQALTLRGLRTAVYCGIGGQAEQLAEVISQRYITPHDRSRPIKTEYIGNYLHSVKENTRAVRAFNSGKLDALISSRMFETQSDVKADALVIATRTNSRRVLGDVLLNFTAPNPEHPNLTVLEFVEIAAGNYGRSSYTVWDVMGEKQIVQGKLIGGHLDARPDPAKQFGLRDLPTSLRARFNEVEGSSVIAATRLTSTAEDFEPLPEGMVPLSEIAASIPHLPEKSVRRRLEEGGAGMRPRIVWQEVDGEMVQVPYYSAAQAAQYFEKNPVPPIAEPGMETVAGMARRFGVSTDTITQIVTSNRGMLQPRRLLLPGRLREFEFYDEHAQGIVEAQVAEQKVRQAEWHAKAAARRAEKVVYEPPREGEASLIELCERAGISFGSARERLTNQVELVVRQGKNRPVFYVASDQVETVLQLITPETLPVDRITAPAMFARMSHRSTRWVAKHLSDFTYMRRRLPGRGPEVLDYSWDAMRQVEETIGVPRDALPIVWDLLPTNAEDATPEQTSYARALQILYQPSARLGEAAIMSPETARLFAEAEYEAWLAVQPEPAEGVAAEPVAETPDAEPLLAEPQEELPPSAPAESEPEPESAPLVLETQEEPELAEPAEPVTSAEPTELAPVEPEPTEDQSAPEVAAEPEQPLPAETENTEEATPETEDELDSIWVADFVTEYNQRASAHVTEKELLDVAGRLQAEVAFEGEVPYLTPAGRQTIETHAASLTPTPQGWLRYTDIASQLGVGYQTIVKELSGDPETGEHPIYPRSLQTGHFMSPAKASELARAILMPRLQSGTELNNNQVSLLAGRSVRDVEAEFARVAPEQAAEHDPGRTYTGAVLRRLLTSLGVQLSDAILAAAQPPKAAPVVPARPVAPEAHHRRQPQQPLRRDQRRNIEQRATAAGQQQQPRTEQQHSIAHTQRPLNMLEISEMTERPPQAVREAIQRAKATLGKKFRSVQQRDRWQVVTEHYTDRAVLQTIEDELLGIRLEDATQRLHIEPDMLNEFLNEMKYAPAAPGRLSTEAFTAAREYFKTS